MHVKQVEPSPEDRVIPAKASSLQGKPRRKFIAGLRPSEARHIAPNLPASANAATEKEFRASGERHDGLGLLVRLLRTIHSEKSALSRALSLMERYGGLNAVVKAAENDFPAEEALSCAEASLLQTVRLVSTNVLRNELIAAQVLGDAQQVHDYLRLALSFERREVTRLLFLDAKNRLIADEPHMYGTLNHTLIYPREVVRRAIVNNAAAMIIVHNHPSGVPDPSMADLEMTNTLYSILDTIGVKLFDHVIVGRYKVTSLRAIGFFPQGPGT